MIVLVVAGTMIAKIIKTTIQYDKITSSPFFMVQIGAIISLFPEKIATAFGSLQYDI